VTMGFCAHENCCELRKEIEGSRKDRWLNRWKGEKQREMRFDDSSDRCDHSMSRDAMSTELLCCEMVAMGDSAGDRWKA
jgi:hypothetical protein